MSDALPLIDIDALAKPVGRVRVGGTFHDVLPINGEAFDLVIAMQENARAEGTTVESAREALSMTRKVIAECIPSVTAVTRNRLNMDQMRSIIAIAMQQVEKVQAMVKVVEGKGSAPARKTTKRARGQ